MYLEVIPGQFHAVRCGTELLNQVQLLLGDSHLVVIETLHEVLNGGR